jgi:hypothetical protein
MRNALFIFLFSLWSLNLLAIPNTLKRLPRAGETAHVQFLDGTKGIASSVKVVALGRMKKLSHVWIAMHGDAPNFYDRYLRRSINILNEKLKKKNSGAILVLPKSKRRDWHYILGHGSTPAQRERQIKKYGSMNIRIFRQIEKLSRKKKLKVQTLSFSGSGRMDRALHLFLDRNYFGEDTSGLDVKDFVDNHFEAMSAADAMVNNSFFDSHKKPKPLVNSWTEFMFSFPNVKVTFIYDRSKEFAYMKAMHQQIIYYYVGHEEAKVPSEFKWYNQQLRVIGAKSHMASYINMFRHIFFFNDKPI